ncbi:MAG: hypothetical protein GY679_00205 [Mycoplasma sp.]|nr:hypothetical protein [Mycoplasma sp.]
MKEYDLSKAKRIADLVEYEFGLAPGIIYSKTREREIVSVRQIAQQITSELTNLSLASIGLAIGCKEHATVLHSIKTVNNLKETDKKYKEEYERILKKCLFISNDASYIDELIKSKNKEIARLKQAKMLLDLNQNNHKWSFLGFIIRLYSRLNYK